MNEMQSQALPVFSPIPVVPAVADPVLPAPDAVRPAPAPQRFARYPK